MNCVRIKFFFVALTIGLFASGLLAQVATVESSNGLLRVRNANQTATMPIGVGQTLGEGAEVSTEPGGVGVLRFADGQKLALASNSSVRISNYRFDAAQPRNSSSVFDLLVGAMRSVSGLIGASNPGGVRFNMATATIGIRGTDLVMALSEIGSHASVLSGEISFSTAGGALDVVAGSVATAVGTLPPVLTTLAAIPAGAAALISELSSLQIAAAGAAAGAGTASATALGGVSTVGLVTGLAVLGGIAAIAGNNGSDGTTGTTGTR